MFHVLDYATRRKTYYAEYHTSPHTDDVVLKRTFTRAQDAKDYEQRFVARRQRLVTAAAMRKMAEVAA